MSLLSDSADELRIILENMHTPDALNTHAWANRLFVTASVSTDSGRQDQGPGQRLVEAVGDVFVKMMPGTSPRHGKRLDTRWGEFGLLAAMYFAPLKFGAPVPTSLRDAWGRIDSSILLFVFGGNADNLQKEQVDAYKLVGDEPEAAPNSTLSDWHRKGIQRLTKVIETHEQFISSHPSSGLVTEAGKPPHRRSPVWKALRVAVPVILLLLLLGGLAFGWVKGRRVYEQARLVWDDANQIKSLAASTPTMETLRQAGSSLATLRQDFTALKNETEPYLWLGPWLKWVPVYGGDLASAQDLVTMTDSLLASADTAYQAGLPLLDAIDQAAVSGLDTSQLTRLVLDAQPQWLDARHKLDAAIVARQRIDVTRLSPRVRELVGKIDPFLPLMQDGLTFAIEFPTLVGASGEGPKTYLLLAQNEDELRPTGGFITAAGTLLIQDGKISSLDFQNSNQLDDWKKPYPVAPWQLQQYMNSPVLIFRDANWFPDYSMSALYAEYLYSYKTEHSVDGVIAFDQQMLVKILGALGPIEVEGAPYPINASNVLAYMREAKVPSDEQKASYIHTNKDFINQISVALIERVFSGHAPWEKLVRALVESLNERHVLAQVDNQTMASLLSRRHWDGSIQPGSGDFLMVVDTNVGFNKTNAVVNTSLFYDVDLTNLKAPTSQLVVNHQNNATKDIPCVQFVKKSEDDSLYPINRCYWDYLRVYIPSGGNLLGATVQTVPGDWMLLKRTVPPQVDVLKEDIEGVRGFGTLKVVPGGDSLASSFQFSLPASILEAQTASGEMLYRLKIQKQPGTLGVPVTIRVHLPNGAAVRGSPAGSIVQGQSVQLETSLTTDIAFELVFTVP
jgi:hypothetical protein